MSTLLQDIELFIADRGMSPTAFGQGALGDKHLVRQMRGGRRLWPETEGKVRQFMADQDDVASHDPASTAAPADPSAGKGAENSPCAICEREDAERVTCAAIRCPHRAEVAA